MHIPLLGDVRSCNVKEENRISPGIHLISEVDLEIMFWDRSDYDHHKSCVFHDQDDVEDDRM